MTASHPTSHDAAARLEVMNNLAHYLRHYPHDLVDAKRLMQRFAVSADEFTQALVHSQQADDTPIPSPALPTPPGRRDAVSRVAHHLWQYPQDIVDIKRLLRHFHLSAHELNQALLRLESLPS
jgi:hypothetical protein